METRICPVCNGMVAPTDKSCPDCGFKLSGSTTAFAPVSLEPEATVIESTPRQEREASLTVLKGPQVGIKIVLGDESLMVGRSPDCEVFLNDMTVSKQHALIDRVDEGYRITDLNSFNGIWINNKNTSSAILADGDIIQIGAFCLQVSC